MTDWTILRRTRPESRVLLGITAQIDCTIIWPNMCTAVKDTNEWKPNCKCNFRIRILNCRGGETIVKIILDGNSTKGEQVRKVVRWHWGILMSEKNGWLMLHVKNVWLLKSHIVRQNCTELTGINNKQIIYTLLNICKCQYNPKETNK